MKVHFQKYRYQLTATEPKLQISTLKTKYLAPLKSTDTVNSLICKIDRPSKLVISDYDICIFARVVITSTYLNFGGICDILGYHKFSKAWFFTDYLNISVLG